MLVPGAAGCVVMLTCSRNPLDLAMDASAAAGKDYQPKQPNSSCKQSESLVWAANHSVSSVTCR